MNRDSFLPPPLLDVHSIHSSFCERRAPSVTASRLFPHQEEHLSLTFAGPPNRGSPGSPAVTKADSGLTPDSRFLSSAHPFWLFSRTLAIGFHSLPLSLVLVPPWEICALLIPAFPPVSPGVEENFSYLRNPKPFSPFNSPAFSFLHDSPP